MKYFLISICLLFAISSAVLAFPISKLSKSSKVEKNIKGFDGIATSNGIDVILTMGNDEKIVVETTDKTQPFVVIKKEKNTLVIKFDDKQGYKEMDDVKVYITAKTIVKLSASGGAHIKVTNTIETPDLSIAISGGGGYNGAIKTSNLNLAQSGGGNASITGSAKNFKLASTGGSTTKGYEFVVDRLTCNMSGGGSVYATVNSDITASISGGSHVFYKGKGKILSEALSGGSVIVHK
jgi:ribosomal protein L31